MKLLSLISVCAVTSLVGCGNSEKNAASEQNPIGAPSGEIVAQESTEQNTSSIPKSVVIRIPVDEQGNPTGEPELRTVVDSASLENEELVAAAFNSGTTAQTVSSEDELDADSSTQSWFIGRRGCGGFGGGFGGGGFGGGGFGGGGFGGGGGGGFGGGWSGGGGWGGFAPQLGFGGGFHNFGFRNGFHGGGFRYGCFNRGW